MSKKKITTLQDAEKALSFCDPNLPHKVWQKIGCALAGEFGDEAFDIFDAWSAPGQTYSAKSTREYWKGWIRNNNPNRPQLNSLAYEAKKGGWVPDRETTLSPEERARREKELAERAARKKRDLAIAQRDAEQNIKQSHVDFFAMPNNLPPTEYMLKKRMTGIVQHLDIRFFTKPGFLGRMFCWPLWDDDPRVNPQAQWCGYEKICDRKNKDKRGKFLSRSGKNDLGFGVIGKPLNQVKRVFICGGLADGFSGHISTGETMVVVVGESNIPNIKRRLQELYPELIVVVSPDNDKEGIAQVEKAGGFWSLPEKDGADWSDVYVHEGAEEVQRQLLNIRGLVYNVVNQPKLDIQIQPGLNLIKSGKETGKTYSTAAWSRDNRQLKTLIISYRRNLLQSLAKDDNFDADYYEHLILGESSNDTDRNVLLRQSMRLVITPDSLWRLQGSEWDAVIVDEADQTLMHFLSDTMLKSGRQVLNCEMFAHLLCRSSFQVMMDADLSDLTVGFCNYIGLQSGTYHINEFKPRQGSTLFVYESPNHMQTVLKDKLLTGERHYFCANSKAQIIKFDEVLQIAKRRGHWNGEWFSVCSDNSTDDQTGEIVREINKRVGEWSTLLASPSWGTGISIDVGHPFQATWGRFNSSTGTVEQAHQQLARARGITEYHVYVDPTERAEPTDPDQILRLNLDEPDAETAKFLKLEDGKLAFSSNLFEWIYCHVKAAVNESKNQFRSRFLAQAEAEGYSIVHVLKNKQLVTWGKEDAEEASERLRRLDMLSMVDANLLDDDQLRMAMHGEADQTQAAIVKSKVYQELNLEAMTSEQAEQLVWDAASTFQSVTALETEFGDDIVNVWPASKRELIINALGFGQQQERLVSRIKKLAVVSMPAELVKALDLKDRKFAQSRAHLHHYAKRRHHLLCILAAVGVDDQLNYDGRTWNAMQITKDLRGWMIRNREALYKYSDVSLTDAAIEEPLQWLHGFLRGLAIDVVTHGQKRVNGQRVHVYGIDGDSLASVRILTGLRVSGIQSKTMNDGKVSHPAQLVNSNQLAQGVTPSIRVEAAPHLTLKTSEDVPTCKESAAESTEILYFADSIPEGSFERVAAYLQEVMREGRAKKLGRRDQMTLIHVAPWLNKQEVISALAEGSAVPLLRHIKEAAKSGVECGADRLSAAVLFELLQSDISHDALAEFLSGAAVQPLGEMA